MKKVSIIVPVYNSEKTLDVCIESIQAQTFDDYEAVFVDDGSTDRSAEIVRKYAEKDERIRLCQKENGGVSSARNYGIREATGENLLFMDSDDYIPAYYLNRMLEILAQKGENTQVITSLKKFTVDEELHGVETDVSEPITLDKSKIVKLYIDGLLNPPWNKLFRTEIVRKYHLKFPEDITLGEDLLFCIDYITTGEIEYFEVLSGTYYYYRQGNEDSLSRKYYENYYETQNSQYLRLKQIVLNLGASQEDANLLNERYGLFLFLTLDYNMGSKNKSFLEKIRANNEILKKSEFKDWIKKNEKNALIRKVYLSDDYFRVWCLQKMLNVYMKFR